MKNLRWNLDALYKGFDTEEFSRDFDLFEAKLKEFAQWTEESFKGREEAAEKLEEFIRRMAEIRKLSARLGAFCHLTLSVDSKNDAAKQGRNRLHNNVGELTKLEVRLIQYLRELEDLDAVMGQSEVLKEHSFFLKEHKRKADHLLSEKEEVIISKMRNTGSNAFSQLQGDLTANLLIEVELDGKKQTLPLPAIRNLAYHEDARVRKEAYEREQAAYAAVEEASAAAINAIKGEVITVAELKGYAQPLEETLEDSRMTKAALDTLMGVIEEYVPDFQRYLRRKAELLGHQNGLPFYDLFAPVGSFNRKFTYDEAIAYIVSNFRGFSPRLADYVQHAYEKEWLDVEPRVGKRGGAFCSNLPVIGESRIMANFNGSFSNMTTLAHELGHGYHGFNLKDESILNTSYPMPIAETASIFNETIVVNAALNEADETEKIAILESSISDANQVIVDIYSRYLFESELFHRRKTSTLSVDELKQIMTDAQKKAYGDGLDHNVLHPYMWVNKPHYYRAGLSFYNFPYAFGLLFAKGLYAMYLDQGEEFLPRYDRLLNETGRSDLKDLTAAIGVDLEDPSFFRSSMELIRGDIEQFLKLTEKEGK